mgnify:CR=1 FL=1
MSILKNGLWFTAGALAVLAAKAIIDEFDEGLGLPIIVNSSQESDRVRDHDDDDEDDF